MRQPRNDIVSLVRRELAEQKRDGSDWELAHTFDNSVVDELLKVIRRLTGRAALAGGER